MSLLLANLRLLLGVAGAADPVRPERGPLNRNRQEDRTLLGGWLPVAIDPSIPDGEACLTNGRQTVALINIGQDEGLDPWLAEMYRKAGIL